MHLDDGKGVCEEIRGGEFLGEEVGFHGKSSFKLLLAVFHLSWGWTFLLTRECSTFQVKV